MRLFYFVTDSYPAWRVDLTELFSNELSALGLATTWSMRRDDGGGFARVRANGEDIYLPVAAPGVPGIAPIIRRLGEVFSEIIIFAKFIFGPRFDFIQVRDDRYAAGLFALLAARLRGSKFIYWVSFPFPENDLEKAKLASGVHRLFLHARGALTRWWLYKTMLSNADHVFVQSNRMKKDIAEYGLPEDRMTPVPMGVSKRLLEWVAVEQHAIEKDSIVYLGSFARARRLETLIEAFSLVIQRVPNAKLYMVGRGDIPEDRLILENLCQRLGIGDQVFFPGFLSKEAAWSRAASAAVCVSPIYSSPIFDCASPTKLYEYMALGRPIVANEHPEQTNALSASGAGLCVPWSAEHFSDAIVYLLEHPDTAEQMGRRGPEWVAEHRRYDGLAKAVFQKYSSLLNQE